jgi:endogenous inhibitor of DNA gyrase (YacG/DUF329 family)
MMPLVAEFLCPICKKPSRPGEGSFPFCSPRCKWLDLGSWLEERYRISRPLAGAAHEVSGGADDRERGGGEAGSDPESGGPAGDEEAGESS